MNFRKMSAVLLLSVMIQPELRAQQASVEKAATAQSVDVENVLRSFRSYYVESNTIYLRRETLQKELQNRTEFPAWKLTATDDSKAADVIITIGLPFLTWEWNYRMIDQATGMVLGTGKVSAAVEKTAAPQLAASIAGRIREARPLPDSFQEGREVQPVTSSRGEKGKSWHLRYMSGPAPNLGRNVPVTLTINREWMTVRHGKAVVFSAPSRYASAVDSRTEVRKATKGWEDFWDHALSGICCGDNDGAQLIPFIPIWLAGEGILAPIKTTDHFVSMYWVEDGSTKSVEFRASGDDAKSILAWLKRITQREAENLQQISDAR